MTNRLAHAKSLYLRKHAENPIDWWPWCDEAIAKARQENKPIFLSIGYSSCHWCTVMEGEAFSNGAIAAYMNDFFVPIKVDREERPDLDSIYMQSLQLMVGQGGWPLNVFLAPDDLVPFYGGTYFPVDPRYGRPGFLQVLQAIRRHFDTEKDKVSAVKQEILEHLQEAGSLEPGQGSDLTHDLLAKGLEYSTGILSARGPGPSFPMIPYGEAAQRATRLSLERYDAGTICQQRGEHLALGGIYDHVAGGFHRYTVDPTWTVPHFEKMLYDNGQILEYLANEWARGVTEPAFERAIAGTVTWLTREMTDAQGYFYAAQDADNFTSPEAPEPEEGDFYVWRYDELAALLTPAELAALQEEFTVTPSGNFEGRNVLQRSREGSLSEVAEAALAKLFAVRYGAPPAAVPTFPPAPSAQVAKTQTWPGRIPPVTDTKMIAAWNSLMISGLARAAAVWQREEYYQLAAGAARFLLAHQWVEGRFHRLNYDGEASVLAQSEDYALFIKALIDLDQARPGAEDWIEQAVKVQREFDALLGAEEGGYYNAARDRSQDLVIRERSYADNATPAPNSIAIANLVRLALLTEDLSYLDRAEKALQSFSAPMARSPQACPSMFGALDLYRNHLLIRATPDVLQTLAARYCPTAVYKVADELPEGAVGLVCQGLSCQEPARSLEQLHTQIQQHQIRA